MIKEYNKTFYLSTNNTAYLLRVTEFGHLEHIYYGALILSDDAAAAAHKRVTCYGGSVMYSEKSDTYCLDTLPLEWSGIGKGDFREPPCETESAGGSTDFIYSSFEITPGAKPASGLPCAEGANQTLTVYLTNSLDPSLQLELIYSVFPDCDVITRRAVLHCTSGSVNIWRMLSYMIDLPDLNYSMVTFDGGWIREAHRSVRPLAAGMSVNESRTGFSSSRHNPGFLLAEDGANEDWGRVYGFNLIYSGSHYSAAEPTVPGLVRVTGGINPLGFNWTLAAGQSFETPEAVLCFSEHGFNSVSDRFHRFVNGHIVRGEWKDRERPVLVNDWESYFFKFTAGKLLRLARRGKKLGAELFVLDDGWFRGRTSDRAGLGDYQVDLKKLPGGLARLAKRINKLNMMFGLWFEPESVNPDSELYRLHPDYAVQLPGVAPALSRNQLLLDLTRAEVRDYIVSSVGRVLDSANIEYVKWDMNRSMSDCYSALLANQGEFRHRYILGLYEILDRIFSPRPHILLESCSSGGNRFDLGMLCFSPQIWASDDTDPVERLEIQGGLSYLYPLSTMGAHVSTAPHQQTLRQTRLSTRFNVSCFGCLGYETKLKYLTPAERRQTFADIAFYKEHRRLFQYGTFSRCPARSGQTVWQVTSPDRSQAICGTFQSHVSASPSGDILSLRALQPDVCYSVSAKPQGLRVSGFGALVHHLLPIRLNPAGFILRTADRLYQLPDCREQFEATGRALTFGVPLNSQFVGSYYNKDIRLMGDAGSYLYYIEKK